MPALVYDTGALLAAERRNPDFLALHDEVTGARIRPIVPVVVLAQAWHGGPQHQISQVLKGCDILPDDAATGRAAGVACARLASAIGVKVRIFPAGDQPPAQRPAGQPRQPKAARRSRRHVAARARPATASSGQNWQADQSTERDHHTAKHTPITAVLDGASVVGTAA